MKDAEIQLWNTLSEAAGLEGVYIQASGQSIRVTMIPTQPETGDISAGDLAVSEDSRVFIVRKDDFGFTPKPKDRINAAGRTWIVCGQPCCVDHGNYGIMMRIQTRADRG